MTWHDRVALWLLLAATILRLILPGALIHRHQWVLLTDRAPTVLWCTDCGAEADPPPMDGG